MILSPICDSVVDAVFFYCPLATVSPRSYGHLTQNAGQSPHHRKRATAGHGGNGIDNLTAQTQTHRTPRAAKRAGQRPGLHKNISCGERLRR